MMSSLRLQSRFQELIRRTKQLASLVEQGHHQQALILFSHMFSSSSLDAFAFPLALKASTALNLPNAAPSIHSHAIKAGLMPNPFIASSLLRSYGKCSAVALARQLFDELPARNAVVVWNAMIALYSRSNDLPNALKLFRSMDVTPNASTYNSIIAALSDEEHDYQAALDFYRHMIRERSGLAPNLITILALLPACVHLGTLSFIKQIQGFAIRCHIHPHPHLASGLVEAYGRCGCLVYARRIFDSLEERDVVAWSSMVSAYALHGNADIATQVFRQMEAQNVRPDDIMFLGILKACSHSGYADDALNYFEIMTERYSIKASSHHYSCLVDVLSRAGRLDEAYQIIKGMPMKATAKTWGALLGACRSYGHVGLAEIAGRVLFEIEPENARNYVLLASIYKRAGMSEEAETVRREMVERGVKRNPGSSWVM